MDTTNKHPDVTDQTQAELEALRAEVVALRQSFAEQQAREEQLKRNLSRLEFIVGKAASAITAQTPGGELIFGNEAAAQILGCSSAEELLTTPLSHLLQKYQILDAEGQPFPFSRLPGRRIIQGEYDSALEELMRFKIQATGEEHWSIVKATPVLNEQGELQFVVNVFHDVTALKLAEAALRIQRQWFEVTLSSIGDAVIATDVEGRITFMNRVAQDLTGWPLQEATGYSLEEVFRIVNEYSRQLVENPVTKVLRQGMVVGLANHTVLLARDGREIPIDDSAAPIREQDGKISGVVLVFRDVTERKETEENERFLAEASQLLTSSLDYQTTLNRLARLTLPRLADYCLIDLFEETEGVEETPEVQTVVASGPGEPGNEEKASNRVLRRVVVAHVDPHKEKVLLAKEIHFLPDLQASDGIGKVLRTGEPAFVPQIGEAELQQAARSEEHLEVLRQLAPCSGISVPMTHQGRVLGTLSLFFTHTESARVYNREGLAFVAELAQRAALAVENARLYQREQLLKTRQAYLARASQVLSSSLDYEITLQRVAELAVPLLADWCSVHVVVEEQDQTPGQSKGIPRQVGLAHSDPARIEWARRIQGEMAERYPYDPEATTGLPEVLRTGNAELYPDLPDELLVAVARDTYQLELLREIGYSSVMIVPMVARNRILGAIQLVATKDSGRHYTAADLAFAKELAQRAALAVDNARLYREAQRAIAAQMEVNQLKDRFLSIASHELRTPLTSIKGFAQLLQRQTVKPKAIGENSPVERGLSSTMTMTEPPSGNLNIAANNNPSLLTSAGIYSQERTWRILSNITGQVSRMDKLIGEMLDVSRIQSGKLELNLTSNLNLAELIQRVIEQQQVANPNRIIQLKNIAQNVSGSFDESRLEQVLNNLISNALKYSPNDTSVTLGLESVSKATPPAIQDLPPNTRQIAPIVNAGDPAREEQESVEEAIVWVKDTGYGISEEDQDHIFESFYRARTRANQGVDGLGLGLYISQQIIQRHGGRMWLESRPGEGSTFYFALPVS